MEPNHVEIPVPDDSDTELVCEECWIKHGVLKSIYVSKISIDGEEKPLHMTWLFWCQPQNVSGLKSN